MDRRQPKIDIVDLDSFLTFELDHHSVAEALDIVVPK
jgi:hypothetical protein